jgi:hypothetical protein
MVATYYKYLHLPPGISGLWEIFMTVEAFDLPGKLM